jgi:hypothetical protein
MAMVGSPISDEELIDYIVVGLGPQYESLQHSLTVLDAAGADNLSMEAFYSMLLSCESLKEQNAQAPEFSTSTNAVARQGGDNRGGGALSPMLLVVALAVAPPGRLVAAMLPMASSSSIASVAIVPTRGRWWRQQRRWPGRWRWSQWPPMSAQPNLQVLGS